MKSSSKKSSAFDKEPENTPVKAEKAKKPDAIKSLVRKPIMMWGIVALIALSGAGSGIYYYLQYQNSQKLLKNPVLGAQVESEKLVDKIGSLIILPQENPTIATVEDATKLKSQTFFANAQNGDKVLIYQNAKKAVLYRPSINKIVEFGPINLGSAEQTSASESAVTQAPKLLNVILKNGTKTSGLANSVEKDLKSKAPNVTVVSKGNASKSDYTKTLVVDLTGTNTEEAKSIAQLLNGEVGKLPAGENASSSADILVILGK